MDEMLYKTFNLIHILTSADDILKREDLTDDEKTRHIYQLKSVGYDGERIFDIDDITINILLQEYNIVKEYFTSRVDSLPFMTDDHKRLRSFLIKWYTANRTIVTLAKSTTDVHRLPTSELNMFLRGLGFPYSYKIPERQNKINLLTSLIDLYKRKGTSTSLGAVLGFTGLTDIRISEWWLHKIPGVEPIQFKFVSSPVYPKGMQEVYEISFYDFVLSDPLWQQSIQELRNEYTHNKINLPSMTPYFSISGAIDVSGFNDGLAIISKKMEESFYYWGKYNRLEEDLDSSYFGLQLPFLAVCLAAIYVLNGPVIKSMRKTPPTDPAEGDQYAIAHSATGEWFGYGGFITRYNNNNWIFVLPKIGTPIYVVDQNQRYILTEDGWIGDVVFKSSVPSDKILQYQDRIDIIPGWKQVVFSANLDYIVKDFIDSIPMGAVTGDTYIISGTADEILYEYRHLLLVKTATAWDISDPLDGEQAFVESTGDYYVFEDRDNIDDLPYNDIKNLYHEINRRPEIVIGTTYSSKEQQKTKYRQFVSSFTRNTDGFFLDSIEIAEQYLTQISPEYKFKIDEAIYNGRILDVINDIYYSLDTYLLHIGILGFPLSTMFNASGMYGGMDDIINTFKPLRARMLAFTTVFKFNNPREDSILIGDRLIPAINSLFVEPPLYGFDHGQIRDEVVVLDFLAPFFEYLFGQYDINIKDESLLVVLESRNDSIITFDSLDLIVDNAFVEPPTYGFDGGHCEDAIWINITEQHNDYIFDKYDSNTKDECLFFVTEDEATTHPIGYVWSHETAAPGEEISVDSNFYWDPITKAQYNTLSWDAVNHQIIFSNS